ncbi:MAG: thiamine pyrophosphate-dependent dehydrogenase E1 component subunit alpha [Thermodesulfobacteriota bacterium]|nr:thiamine pyrophosphate-dependent dehydrogenase E1 component subunit alpha [Thermodesulfobacteriota bacterium]
MQLNNEFMIQLYRTMLMIRRFEEKALDLKARQIIPGLLHLYIGEEAVATGMCAALRRDDYISSTHRGHGHCIAKGGDISLMMAELLGREKGYCRGKGGSMHIADIDLGILGANGVVAAGMPISGGAALSIKMRGKDQVVACFFGDGGSNQGAFHESLNMAALWKLPVIYVCENNQYAISVAQSRSCSIRDIYLRKDAYEIEGCMVDGNDVLAVYQAAKETVDRARRGEGPTLIECKTYRWRGHYEGEADRTYTYRTKQEIEEWIDRCPIKRFQKVLLDQGVVSQVGLNQIEQEIQSDLQKAMEFAQNCPFPEPQDALKDLYYEE